MAIWTYMRGNEILDIKVGYTCNNKCVHCVVEPVRQEIEENNERINLTTDEILFLIDKSTGKGVNTVVLTGGEVTLRKDFNRLVSYAVGKGLKVNIQTNGRMFSDKKFCEPLKDLEGLVFIIAIHGSNAPIHDSITKMPGSFYETIGAIENLRALNKEITAKIVMSSFNCGDLVNTTRFVKDMGVNKFCVVFPHAPGYTKEQFLAIVPRYSALKDQISEIASFSEKENFHISFETIPYCASRNSRAFWSRNCDLFSKANVMDEEKSATGRQWSDLLNWEDLRPNMKKKGSGCAKCVFDHMCEGPWMEYVDNYGFEEFIPITEYEVRDML